MSHIDVMVPGARVETRDSSRGGLREVASLAIPAVLQNLSVALMQLVDAAIVSGLGKAELGGVGYGGVWTWTWLCFFVGTANGVQSFVAQAHGAKREQECGPWIWQALAVIVPTTALGIAAFVLCYPFFVDWLAPSASLREPAIAYAQVRAPGLLGVVCGVVLHSFLRGVGRMTAPLVAGVLVNVLNALLAYGLVYGVAGLPELGVRGAGIATSCAEWVYALILLVVVLRPATRSEFRTGLVRPQSVLLRRFVRTSAPIGGQWFLDMITFALFTNLIARMGEESMAASQSFLALLHLSFMQAVGIQIAASTLVGRYVGAGDLASAVRSYRSSLLLVAIVASVVAAVFVFFPETLLGLFHADAAAMALGTPLLFLGALFSVFDAFAIVASGALRGAGDTRFPFWIQTSLAWTVFLPAAWLIGVWLEGGVLGAWVGGSIYVIALAVALVLRFHSGAWQSIRI